MLDRFLLFAGAVAVTAGLVFPDPGVPKPGRVVIDDSHSFEWEQAARRLDTEFFGDFSTYSFSTMAEHLSRSMDVSVTVTRERLLDAVARCDVLVLKTPQIDYSSEEVSAIQEFVRSGGGLIVIGDHTNLFGMNTRLNEVLAGMDLLLRDDSVRSTENDYFVTASPPVFGRHPATGSIDPLMFMTGCSVWARNPSHIVLWARASASDAADYINNSNFPTWSNDPGRPSGNVGVVAARPWGKGRVVVLTDGTPFSSFDYYKRNHSEAMAALVNWANRENGPGWPGMVILSLGVLQLALSLAVVSRNSILEPASLAIVTVGLYCGLLLGSLAGKHFYPPLKANAGPPDVVFVAQGCFAAFPPSLGSPGPVADEAVFDTLFNVPLRLGRRSRLEDNINALAQDGSQTVVFVNLVDEMEDRELHRLFEWLDGGGEILVLQRSALYRTPGARQLAERCGVGLELNADRTPWMPGTNLRESPAGVIAGERTVGKGRIVFAVNDDQLCNAALGHSMSIPQESQRALYDFLYQVFRYDGPRVDLCKVLR
jgi:hypothetical protein